MGAQGVLVGRCEVQGMGSVGVGTSVRGVGLGRV